MKTLILFVTLLPSVAFAKGVDLTNQDVHDLVSRATSNRARMAVKIESGTPLLEYFMSPEQPQQGDTVTIFAETQTDFTGEEFVLNAAFDNAAVTVTQPTNDMFIYEAGSFGTIGAHTFQGTLYIQNHQDAENLRGSIRQLNSQIVSVQAQIAAATDPNVIAALQAQLSQLQSQQALLTQTLAGLPVSIGEQDFSFNVRANATSPDFPHIVGISPNFAKLNTAETVTITGTDFPANPVVTIGGQPVAVTSASATSIVGTAPAFTAAGAMDLEVNFTNSGQTTGTNLKDAFFVESASMISACFVP